MVILPLIQVGEAVIQFRAQQVQFMLNLVQLVLVQMLLSRDIQHLLTHGHNYLLHSIIKQKMQFMV